MNTRVLLAVAVTTTLVGCAGESAHKSPAPTPAKPVAAAPAPAAPRWNYPAAARGDVVDDYFGEKVADPYRWMESLDAPEVKAWITAENAVTEKYLADTPRDRIKAKLTAVYNFERYNVPKARGERLFYSKNDGLQNQAPWYWQDGVDGKATLLIDPNTLSTDGTVALSEAEPSNRGRLFAYSLSDGGSDWRTIKVRDVATGKDTGDEIHWAKFTNIAWDHDDRGFYYGRFDEPKGESQLKAVNKFQKIFHHTLGTPQSADTLVYERKDQPDWGFAATVSDDGRFLIINVSQGTDERDLVFYRDLSQPRSAVVELVRERKAHYEFLGNVGDTLYFQTDESAERSRVVTVKLGKTPEWKELIPQSDANLRNTVMLKGQLLAHYLRDARSELVAYGLDGKRGATVTLPAIGTVADLHGGSAEKRAFFSFATFVAPTATYSYDATSGTIAAFKTPTTAFNSADYETRQVFYPSKDGTRVPMFITARKGLAMTGANPTILYGYGGFNIPVTPTFNPANAAWLAMGGVYAVANLRGGGEYGTRWHEGGMKTRKQNVFDDFAAGAEYLIREKVTSPKKLAISGRSNGGLLVGATMLQRPELFGAALPAVGVQDMLRFREFTIGWAWESDYGSVKNADEYRAIRAYSPVHNVQSGVNYPPTLVTTADHDDRVFPAHSFKFAAALQAAHPANPMLIRVETRAGHGAGKSTTKQIEENTDIFAFLVKTLGMTVD